jgi:AcrR family transcriptional regulator
VVDQRRAGHETERDETGRLIVQAARRLFMAHGYRAVSTRLVAEAAGLTQPALYHHFATKEELYVAVALAELARLQAGLERIARRDAQADERLRGAARFLLTTVDYDFPLMHHDMRTELGDESRQRLGAAFYGGIIGPLAMIFGDGQRNASLRDEKQGGLSASEAAGFFMSLVAHFLERPLVAPPVTQRRSSEERVDLLMGLLLNGVGIARAGTI